MLTRLSLLGILLAAGLGLGMPVYWRAASRNLPAAPAQATRYEFVEHVIDSAYICDDNFHPRATRTSAQATYDFTFRSDTLAAGCTAATIPDGKLTLNFPATFTDGVAFTPAINAAGTFQLRVDAQHFSVRGYGLTVDTVIDRLPKREDPGVHQDLRNAPCPLARFRKNPPLNGGTDAAPGLNPFANNASCSVKVPDLFQDFEGNQVLIISTVDLVVGGDPIGPANFFNYTGLRLLRFTITSKYRPSQTPQAQISLSPSELNFKTQVLGNNPAPQTVTLRNTGGAPLNWQAQATPDNNGGNWLSVTPASGSLAANQAMTLTVAAERKKVNPALAGGEPGPILAGDYTGTIRVSASGASNSPQTVNVKFTLDCPGGAALSSLSAAIPAGLAQQQRCANEVTLDPDSARPSNNAEVIRVGLETTGITVPVSYYLLPPNAPAGLVLRVFDQTGALRGSSAVLPVTQPGASPDPVTLTIQGKDINLELLTGVQVKTLTVKAFLLNVGPPEKLIKESGTVVNYTVKSDALFFIGGSLKLNGQPAPDGSNFPGDGKINNPGFSCQLGYELVNAGSGEIRLTAVSSIFSPGGSQALSTTQHIPVTDQAGTKAGLLSFVVPPEVPSIQIFAELYSSDTTPRALALIIINYSRASLRIELGTNDSSDFDPLPDTPFLDSGLALWKQLSLQKSVPLLVRVTYDLAAPSGKLQLLLTERLKDGTLKRGRQVLAENNQVPGGVQKQIILQMPNQRVPDDVDQWVLTVLLLAADGRQIGLSDPLLLPITRVRLADYAPLDDPPLLTLGKPVEFSYTLEYNVIRAGVNELKPRPLAVLPGIANVEPIEANPKIIAQLNSGDYDLRRMGKLRFTVPNANIIKGVKVFFTLENAAFPGKQAVSTVFGSYGVKGAEPVAEPESSYPGGKANNVKNPTNLRPIPSRVEKDFKNALNVIEEVTPQSPNQFKRAKLSTQQALPASLNARDLLSLNAYWQFDPPIARARGFSADLTFEYEDNLFPDDPNFNAAKLQVISYDPATGSLESYPTTLDAARKTVTAHVNWLAPYYTVGVVGPFPNQTLNTAFFSTGNDLGTRLNLVNLGTGNAALKLNGYDRAGELINNTITTALPAQQQLARTAAELFNPGTSILNGWVQTRADKTGLVGYQLIGSGNRMDGLNLPAFYSISALLTDIEYDNTYATQIQLANVTNFAANVRLELHAATGAQVGATYQTTLQPKEPFAGLAHEIFPNLVRPFSGYLLVRSDNDIAAAELLHANAELAALNGQLPPSASNTATKLYAPYFAHDSRALTTTLNLVNPTARAANLTLRAVNASGANLAPPVTIALAAGQQYRRAAGQIFNLTANLLTEGSLIIESNITGVLGDTSYSDPTNAQPFRAALPLTSEPAKFAAFAHLDNRADSFTQFAIFNPDTQSASVEVKVQRANGSVVGSARVNVPAGGGFSKRLTEVVPASAGQQGGYFTLNADQPITASAVFGTLARTTLSALPAQPFTKQCLEVSLPANLTGNRGSALTVPLITTDTTGADAIAFDAVITYDPAVLRLQNPPTDKTGTLSGGMTITTNSPTAGRLNISAFGATPLTGAGALLNLKFDVTGAASACSGLTVASFRFNEDSPCATTTNGRACVADPNANNAVELPQLTAANGAGLTLPITVGDLTGRGFIAYDFDLSFDQSVLQLQSPPFDAAGTLSSGMTITPNATAGRLRLSAFGTTPLAGAGTLLRLKFNVVGAAGASTNLSWQRFVFNETPQTNPAPGRVNVANALASLSAASFTGQQLAPESIVAAFGVGLANSIVSANETPLPTTLAGTTVRVRDSAGTERLAPLFFVAPSQINYLIPLGTATGTATITVTSGAGTVSLGNVSLAAVAPGLFTANANGQGVAAAVAFRIKADGAQSFELISRFDPALNRFVSVPIDLGPAGEQVFLILFGTGLRFHSSLANVAALIGGASAPVSFAGAQGLAGLDQVNVAVPRSLAGRGEVDLVLTVDGKAANTVRVNIK